MVSFDAKEITANTLAHRIIGTEEEEENNNNNKRIVVGSSCCCDPDFGKKQETMNSTTMTATTTTPTPTTTTTTNNNSCFYRMVALDLDGTILQSNRQISDATVNYLRDLSSRGIIIAICTGRSFQSAFPYIQRLKHLSSSSPISHSKQSKQQQQRLIPIVCTNGAKGMLVDPHKDYHLLPLCSNNGNGSSKNHDDNAINPHRDTIVKTTLFHNTFSIEAMDFIEDIAEGVNTEVVVVWYYDQYTHVYTTNKDDIQLVQLFEKVTKSKITILPPSHRRSSGRWEQQQDKDGSGSSCCLLPSRVVILFHDFNSDVRSIATEFESQLDPNEAYIVSGFTKLYMEILPGIRVNKGNALHELCDALNVPIEECIAVGDGDNDAEFLDEAGYGICMKNGSQKTKSVADYVTKQTNDEDGAIQALKYLQETKIIQFCNADTRYH